jgi:hypothetical protein
MEFAQSISVIVQHHHHHHIGPKSMVIAAAAAKYRRLSIKKLLYAGSSFLALFGKKLLFE